MLFFMISSAHLSLGGPLVHASIVSMALVVLIILAIQANAVFGKPGPMASIKGVIACGFGLTVVLWALLSFL